MRELTSHKVNGVDSVNDGLKVVVEDEPGCGGANHKYHIEYEKTTGVKWISIRFQNGPIKEVGANGITDEAVLAVLIDRLEGFQRGPFASEANASALRHLEATQLNLL